MSWSDDEEEPSGESVNYVVALTGRCDSEKDPYGDEITYDELFESYEDMCHELLKQKKTIVELESENERLLSTVSELKKEVRVLTFQLDKLAKPVKMNKVGPQIGVILLKITSSC